MPGKEAAVQKLLCMVGATIGGAAGWWIGERFGFMTAFALSTVGTIAGVYLGIRFARDYLG